MALRLVSLLLLVAIAVVAESSSGATASPAHWALTRFASGGDGGLDTSHMCDGLVGECIDEEEMIMESEMSRRGLMAARHGRFISYGALMKNRVPCNRRGQSYYNCQRGGRANPYRRGCSIITRCARIVH